MVIIYLENSLCYNFFLIFKPSKKYVSKEISKDIHSKAAPFLTWLKEAEEESEDSGEDEGDEGVEVS